MATARRRKGTLEVVDSAGPTRPAVTEPTHGTPGAPVPPDPVPEPPAPDPAPPARDLGHAPPGFDMAKWGNLDWNTDKYKAGRLLAGGGSLDDVIAALGSDRFRRIPGSEDKIADHNGTIWDLLYDVGGPEQRVQWTEVGRMGAPPQQTSSYTPPGTRSSPMSSAVTSLARGLPQAGAAPARNPAAAAGPTQAANPFTGPKPAWADTSRGQSIYGQMRAAFPDMSDAEIWSHIGSPQAPDARYLSAIMNNIRQSRQQQQAPAAPAPAAPTPPASQTPEFDDFWGSGFESAIMQRLNQLQQPQSFPQLDQLVQRLLQADTRNQANVGQFVNATRGRINELQAPPYTDSQEAALRAKAFDQLERRRSQTQRNEQERMFMLGHAPTSGTIEENRQNINTQFEDVRGGIESDLLRDAIAETQRRKDQALQLEGFIADALNGADLQSLSFLSNVADIEQQQYGDREGRQREVLATYAPILDLISNRSQLLNQSAGLGGNPGSVIDSLMGLLSMGTQQSQIGRTFGANNIAGLAQLAAMLPGLVR